MVTVKDRPRHGIAAGTGAAPTAGRRVRVGAAARSPNSERRVILMDTDTTELSCPKQAGIELSSRILRGIGISSAIGPVLSDVCTKPRLSAEAGLTELQTGVVLR